MIKSLYRPYFDSTYMTIPWCSPALLQSGNIQVWLGSYGSVLIQWEFTQVLRRDSGNPLAHQQCIYDSFISSGQKTLCIPLTLTKCLLRKGHHLSIWNQRWVRHGTLFKKNTVCWGETDKWTKMYSADSTMPTWFILENLPHGTFLDFVSKPQETPYHSP